ncbi:MAG: ABC transporter ATP-binding protein, partial [Hyphomonadaceae bacterium]
MTELRVENISVSKDGKTLVRDVSFALVQGELTVMLGPNGAGKSLCLQHALGLDRPDTGTAHLDGGDVQTLSPQRRARALAYLPQTRKLAWPARVDDLVGLGRFAYGARMGKLGDKDAQAVQTALAACDISHLAIRKASTLSGGELARVHCARAFAAEAPLLVADEPIAALDPSHQF